MTRPNDSKAARKDSAAAAGDQDVFEETPFGRQRKPGPARWFLSRLLHVVGFPFFYVYNQLRTRKRSSAQKWFDDGGRHGNDPNPTTSGKAGRGT